VRIDFLAFDLARFEDILGQRVQHRFRPQLESGGLPSGRSDAPAGVAHRRDARRYARGSSGIPASLSARGYRFLFAAPSG